MLTLHNENNITQITQFTMSREKLIEEKNEKLFDDRIDIIYKYFNKYSLKFNQRKLIKHYIITILNSMCDEMFLMFDSKTLKKKIGNDYTMTTNYFITFKNFPAIETPILSCGDTNNTKSEGTEEK